MASILQPLNIQLPASALQQATSAFGAYEQLRGIQDARRAKAEEATRQALVRQLAGQAVTGNQQALQQLATVDPNAALGLQKAQLELMQGQASLNKTQAETATEQAALPQVEQQSLQSQRDEQLRQAAVMKSAARRIRANPEQYPQIAQALVSRGIVRPGEMPESTPTPEELDAMESSADFAAELAQSPRAAQEFSGDLAEARAAYGDDPERLQNAAERLFESRLALREAQAARASAEKQINGVNVPPGLTLLNPNVQPTKEEIKEARNVVGGVAPVLSSINALERFVRQVGTEVFPTTSAKRAEGMAAFIQLQLKDAMQLGALDAGSERFLKRIFPKDPTQFRQSVVLGNINDVRRQLVDQMRIKVRLRNMGVNVSEVVRGDSSGNITTRTGKPAVTGARQREMVEFLQKERGMSAQDAQESVQAFVNGTMETQDGTTAQDVAGVEPSQPDAVPVAVAPVQNERSFVAEMIDAGKSKEEIRQAVRQRRTQARRQRAQAQRKARNALANPESLSPQQRQQVIRQGIEGAGLLNAAENVLGEK